MTTIKEQIDLASAHLEYYKQLEKLYPDAETNEQGLWVSEKTNNDLDRVEIVNGTARKFTLVGEIKVYGTLVEPTDLAARLDKELALKQAQLDALNAELAAKQTE